MNASTMQVASTPAWVREPDRAAVREHETEVDGRRFCLRFQQRQLLELTELRAGSEYLVPEGSPWWDLFALEVSAGAFDDND